MRMTTFVRGLGLVAALAVTGCKSLDITNPNQPDSGRALADPAAAWSEVAADFARAPAEQRAALRQGLVKAALAAGKTVDASAAIQLVAAVAALQNVIASPAIQLVVADAPPKRIKAVLAV